MSDDKKDIKVVTGDGKELKISPVYEHTKMDSDNDKDSNNNNKNIVIPKGNSSKK